MRTAQRIAQQYWTHTDSVTGIVREWHQEDESMVQTREQAIGVMQRTLDFWLVKMRDDLLAQNKVPDLPAAERMSITVMKKTLSEMSSGDSFYGRFGLTANDFKFEFPSNGQPD